MRLLPLPTPIQALPQALRRPALPAAVLLAAALHVLVLVAADDWMLRARPSGAAADAVRRLSVRSISAPAPPMSGADPVAGRPQPGAADLGPTMVRAAPHRQLAARVHRQAPKAGVAWPHARVRPRPVRSAATPGSTGIGLATQQAPTDTLAAALVAMPPGAVGSATEGRDVAADTPAVSAAAAEPAEARHTSEPADLPPPPTRIPAPFAASYRLRRGALHSHGTLSWQPDAEHYGMRFVARGDAETATWLVWHSEGALGATGLDPRRHTERSGRRSERAVSFEPGDAAAPGQIRYSGSSAVRPRAPLVQDRLSWIAQLAAIAAAWPDARPPPRVTVHLPVAAAAGDLQAWQLQVIDGPSPGAAGWIGLRHVPVAPYETAVEVWLDPAAGFWPARLRLQDARGPALELEREADSPSPAAPP